LFFGMRDPDSDFLYGPEIGEWLAQDHLSQLVTAVSRGADPRYVQDALRAQAAPLSALIQNGARVMVCGGRDMAYGVAAVLDQILSPVGMTPTSLKAEGRYVEDIY
ncbi:MAG: N-acetylglucosamine transferase, partial [Paracoccus sp. (in: a-proteobacteria)]|nr:N-acetylglucosamine transferase [Paracoccus sp. (in: a-proteobacteria)]